MHKGLCALKENQYDSLPIEAEAVSGFFSPKEKLQAGQRDSLAEDFLADVSVSNSSGWL